MVIYVLRSTTSLRLIFESTFQLLSFYPKSKPSNLLGILRTIMKSHAIPPKCHYLLQLSGLPWRFLWGVSKKTEKLRKLEKNNWKNQTVKKNRLKFWKNQPVRFYKPKTKKTGKNRTKTGFCSKKLNWNQSVWTDFVFF
jgi:hypothetical protein